MSFSSEASWRTHLLILHRIKAPKAADFCSDLRYEDARLKKSFLGCESFILLAHFCADDIFFRVPSTPKRKRIPKSVAPHEPAINTKEADGPKSVSDLRRMPQPDNADKTEAASTPDDDDEGEGKLVIDEEESKPFRSRQNVCSVCRSAFSSPRELQRHFRGHGMAFLKGKNPLMSAKNPLLLGVKQRRDK